MNAKPGFAFAKNVQASIIEPFDFDNTRTHTNAMYRLVAFFFRTLAEKHQPEHFILVDAAIDHQLVTFFENVKGNDDVWEQN
jgi:hypothetical protein